MFSQGKATRATTALFETHVFSSKVSDVTTVQLQANVFSRKATSATTVLFDTHVPSSNVITVTTVQLQAIVFSRKLLVQLRPCLQHMFPQVKLLL